KHPAACQTLQVMHDHDFLKHFWPTLDECWSEQEGELVRHLLKLRGEAILRGHYSNSRGLALSTVAIPFLMTAMNPENPTDFWPGSLSFNPTAHRALGIVFEGFKLPNAFMHRILDIVGLVPRMLRDQNRQRLLQHIEYRYGRALLALLVQAFGWDGAALLQNYPEFAPAYGTWDGAEKASEAEAPSSPEAVPANVDGADESIPHDEAAPKRARRPRRRKAADTNSEPDGPAPAASLPLIPLAPSSDASPCAAGKPKEGLASENSSVKSQLLPLSAPPPSTKTPPQPSLRAAKTKKSAKAQPPAEKKLLSLHKDGQRVPLPAATPAEPQEIGASFLPVTASQRKVPAKTESITFSPASHPSRRKTAK
ncbi:MAG: hypothetical protein IKS83_03000, partial [Victivallales bacterium]|nr:hypothetical protein [Victivallales bacterium]